MQSFSAAEVGTDFNSRFCFGVLVKNQFSILAECDENGSENDQAFHLDAFGDRSCT